jgi:hypothetical protein
MISAPDRQYAVELIDEAVAAGATAHQACAELGITLRTYQRWTRGGAVKADERPQALRPEPANKLSAQERQAILDICNQGEYASLPPARESCPSSPTKVATSPRRRASTGCCGPRINSITAVRRKRHGV